MWLPVILWTILGLWVMCSDRVSKFDYVMVWILLMVNLIMNAL